MSEKSAEDTRKQQQEHYEGRQIAEQERFDRQQLANEFTDILNRFATENPLMRASAASRLAEMAIRPLPGNTPEVTASNFFFFPRVSAQLATALHMDGEQAVRDEVIKAIKRMADFSHHGDQVLLLLQIDDLADANRSAKNAFIETLAEYCSWPENSLVDDVALRPLVGFTRFCDEMTGHTLYCVRDLVDSSECQNAILVQKTLRQSKVATTGGDSAPNDNCDEYAATLRKLQKQAANLRDTRDALCVCLDHLARPSTLPASPTDLLVWRRSKALNLSGCFLAGANLSRTQLQGASLIGSYLEGAYLFEAGLERAILSGANMQEARLDTAHIEAANLELTRLQGAHMWHVHMDYVFLHDTRFEEEAVGDREEPSKDRGYRFGRRASIEQSNWWDAKAESWLFQEDMKRWLEVNAPKP